MSDISNMILRTVYLTPEIDSLLRTRAFHADISKNELIRKYLEAGIKADREAAKREAKELEAAEAGLRGYPFLRPMQAAAKKKPRKRASMRPLSLTYGGTGVRSAAEKTMAKKVASRKAAVKKAVPKKAAAKRSASRKTM